MDRDPKKCIPANALLEEGCCHAGFVLKEGGRFRQKQPRYFILHEGCLYYYKDFTSQKEHDAFSVLGYNVQEDDDGDKFGISLTGPGKRTYNFSVSSEEERKTWISKLNQEITRIAGDGSESNPEGTLEQYDYAYQKMNIGKEEEQHNYEPTDEMETFQNQNNNSFSRQTNKNYSDHTRNGPPPAVPSRDSKNPPSRVDEMNKNRTLGMGPRSMNNNENPSRGGRDTLPAANKKPFQNLPIHSRAKNNYTLPPFPNQDSKPKVPVSAKPQTSKKPQVPIKTFPNNPNAPKRTEEEKLSRRLQQSYEIQMLNKKDDGNDSDDSEGYLDLEGEGVDNVRQKVLARQRPIGGSIKKQDQDECYEKPLKITANDSDEALLPISVYQDALSRDSAEDILSSVQKEGMYLIRKGRTGRQVITVYVEEGCKHYQIFEKEGTLFLKETEPIFKTLADLIRHYFTHPLPTCPKMLSLPYS